MLPAPLGNVSVTRRWSVAPEVSEPRFVSAERGADHRPRGEDGGGRAAARVRVGRAGLGPGGRALVDHHLEAVRRVGVEQRGGRRARRQRDRGEIERALVDQVDAALHGVTGRERGRADGQTVRRGAGRAEGDRHRARGDRVVRGGRAREGRERSEAGDAAAAPSRATEATSLRVRVRRRGRWHLPYRWKGRCLRTDRASSRRYWPQLRAPLARAGLSA